MFEFPRCLELVKIELEEPKLFCVGLVVDWTFELGHILKASSSLQTAVYLEPIFSIKVVDAPMSRRNMKRVWLCG